MLKVLITDDQPIIRRGIRQILLEEFSFVHLEEVPGCSELLDKVKTEYWDLVMMDPAVHGVLETLKVIRQESPKLAVLILSSRPEAQFAMKCIQQGASGYLNKDSEARELIMAVRQVLAGKKYIPVKIATSDLRDTEGLPHEKLSERELDVFRLLASGKTVAEIARMLSLESNTVSTYRSRLLSKMNMRTNVDILRYAMEHGLI